MNVRSELPHLLLLILKRNTTSAVAKKTVILISADGLLIVFYLKMCSYFNQFTSHLITSEILLGLAVRTILEYHTPNASCSFWYHMFSFHEFVSVIFWVNLK